MNNRNATALFFTLCAFVSGCVSHTNGVNHLGSNYLIISNTSLKTPIEALSKIKLILQEEGFMVRVDPTFYEVTTSKKSLGYLTWRRADESWKVEFAVGINLFQKLNGDIYWNLKYTIYGERHSSIQRNFDLNDFEKVRKEIEHIERSINDALTIKV